MTIVINGTTGISGVDGSAGTPAVQGTDTNTGVFYPAADTVGVSTGGSERMRVDSSGNVGIGTSSASYKLQVAGSIKETQSSEAATVGNVQSTFASSFQRTSTDTVFNIGYATTPDAWVLSASYGTTGAYKPIAFATSDTERMRIDSSGNVGIGTSSPAYPLTLGNNKRIGALNTGGAGVNFAILDGSNNVYLGDYSTNSSNTYLSGASNVIFGTGNSNTERMRIDSSGVVGLNTASGTPRFEVGNITDSNNQGVRLSGSGDTTLQHLSATSNTLNFQQYYSSAWRTAAQIVGNSTADFKFNSGYGSVATAYGCRAWVNFNGTGTVAIRASGNVTSITDNGVGLYGVNLTNAMPDANYATIADSNVDNTTVSTGNGAGSGGISAAVSTTLFKVGTGNTAGPADMAYISAAAFR